MPKEGHPKVHTKHTRHLRPKKKRGTHKTTSSPHLQPSQSMKSNEDNKLKPTCTLIQSKNMYKMDCEIAWSANLESSKALWFLSFYKVQNKHKGATLHAFFTFLPNKSTGPTKNASLTEDDTTHWTPKRAKISYQSKAAMEQWRSIWFVDSSSPLHK